MVGWTQQGQRVEFGDFGYFNYPIGCLILRPGTDFPAKKVGWKKGPCGVNFDFFFSGKGVQHSPTPPRCTPGRDWSSNDVFIEIFDFPFCLTCGQFGPPPDLGNAPTGSKKVKSTPEHFLCCFFTPIRVATKCLGAQSAFWENRCSRSSHMCVISGCSQNGIEPPDHKNWSPSIGTALDNVYMVYLAPL